MNDAVALCVANIQQRKSVARTNYVLYYGHNTDRYENKMTAPTVKKLIADFKEMGGNFRYAVITRYGDDKPLRFFDRTLSNKFFSMTRKSTRKA